MLANLKKVFTLTNALVLGVVVAVVGLAYLFYRRRRATPKKSDEPVCEVFYFYTAWCPYCKKARPEWDKFKAPLQRTTRDGYLLLFTEVDCDADEALANKFEVTSYPTIKCVKDGNVTDYDARPSLATLNQFLDSCF
jgi:thioredoxin-like negative regulator of GroEL